MEDISAKLTYFVNKMAEEEEEEQKQNGRDVLEKIKGVSDKVIFLCTFGQRHSI